MFKVFCSTFNAAPNKKKIDIKENHREIFGSSIGAIDFLEQFSGQSFMEGLYRVHKLNDLEKWNDIVAKAFPSYRDRIFCFAYDWLGRHFALDFKRVEDGEPMILLLEPGTGEVLEIPVNFMTFHEEEIVVYADAALASVFFDDWKNENARTLEKHECVGYIVPLFLGGIDELTNLEVTDMEVYWDLTGQLLAGANFN